MRARTPIAVAAVLLALAQAGCGAASRDAATFTCSHLRDTTGAFRDEARVLVARSRLTAHRTSREEAILDAELQIRRACAGAAGATQPYTRASGHGASRWVTPGASR
jgi:hypothetical protein